MRESAGIVRHKHARAHHTSELCGLPRVGSLLIFSCSFQTTKRILSRTGGLRGWSRGDISSFLFFSFLFFSFLFFFLFPEKRSVSLSYRRVSRMVSGWQRVFRILSVCRWTSTGGCWWRTSITTPFAKSLPRVLLRRWRATERVALRMERVLCVCVCVRVCVCCVFACVCMCDYLYSFSPSIPFFCKPTDTFFHFSFCNCFQ